MEDPSCSTKACFFFLSINNVIIFRLNLGVTKYFKMSHSKTKLAEEERFKWTFTRVVVQIT